MPSDLLTRLQAANAFDAAPVLHELHELHVPFDELGALPPPVVGAWEQALDAALRRGERVAVLGASGEGKSSLMQYVLRPTVEALFPLPIPVALADASVTRDPISFVEHVVAMVERHVVHSLPARAGATGRGPSSNVAHSYKWSVAPELMGVKLEVAREVQAVVENSPRTGTEAVVTAQLLLEVIAQAGLVATLVLDDTDKWVRGPTGQVDSEQRDDFFGTVVRVIAEHLGCAAAVAVHRSYADDDAYRAAVGGFLSSVVDLPRLGGPAAVSRLLEQRQRVTQLPGEPGEPVDAVWSPEALERMHQAYAAGAGRSLRWLVQLAHLGLAVACDAGAARIEQRHIEAGLRELAD
ncbi:MAG: hypothetical protein QOC98_578 [Frankiaceae bacterium]|jgi:hypothetical protein|nr:hypothetical protein [Frankiaceae bacterium]